MSTPNNAYSKIIYLTFPPMVSGRPVVCNLVKLYNLSFNILKADINPRQQGAMTLELTGQEDQFEQGINYLKEAGIRITPVAQKIFRNEEECIHCGLCTSLCPTAALSLAPQSRTVTFDVDKCSACGICTRICPVKAMSIDLDDLILD